jgi:hypothetical protein
MLSFGLMSDGSMKQQWNWAFHIQGANHAFAAERKHPLTDWHPQSAEP